MRWLVVSPIPTHPTNQGNASRIFVLCRQLQTCGVTVHFLYYPLEGRAPRQVDAMAAAWDHLHVLPDCSRIPKPGVHGYGIDDWCSEALARFVEHLDRRWCFDAIMVNYVWLSRAFSRLGSGPVRILDAHDVFGGRADYFARLGMNPEWFYTTEEQESIGLRRADVVVAIQRSEEAIFWSRVGGEGTRVTTIGHILAPSRVRARVSSDRKTLGYVGSGNPFNVRSMRAFAEEVESNSRLRLFRYNVGGAICSYLPRTGPFDLVGPVDSLADFYGEVDAVINPMLGGTGLKIKTLEALAFGRAFVGTASALDGIPIVRSVSTDAHDAELANDLKRLFADRYEVLSAADACATFASYVQEQQRMLRELVLSARRASSSVSTEGGLAP